MQKRGWTSLLLIRGKLLPTSFISMNLTDVTWGKPGQNEGRKPVRIP